MKIDIINYNGEEYVILPKNAYNTLVYTIQGIKQPTNDQVSLEEKAEQILAGGAAL